mmetsp:Transcript_23094/g.61246  ORF Transcript_23094/g.61246 Transcript_23094/m.61246 type:complete len:224 (+) Transcript_23094:99-770(+)
MSKAPNLLLRLLASIPRDTLRHMRHKVLHIVPRDNAHIHLIQKRHPLLHPRGQLRLAPRLRHHRPRRHDRHQRRLRSPPIPRRALQRPRRRVLLPELRRGHEHDARLGGAVDGVRHAEGGVGGEDGGGRGRQFGLVELLAEGKDVGGGTLAAGLGLGVGEGHGAELLGGERLEVGGGGVVGCLGEACGGDRNFADERVEAHCVGRWRGKQELMICEGVIGLRS